MAESEKRGAVLTPGTENIPEAISSVGLGVNDLTTIVSSILSTEESINESITQFKSVLTVDNVDIFVRGFDKITTYLDVTANMLVAIAGYLYGEKGLGFDTRAGQLLGKIKNSEPILGEAPLNKAMAVTPKEKDKNAKTPKLEIIIKGIDEKGIKGLVEVIEKLKINYKKADTASIKALTGSLKLIETLIKEIEKVPFEKLDKKKVKNAIEFSKNTKDIIDTLSGISKLKIPKINAKAIIKSLLEIKKVAEQIVLMEITPLKKSEVKKFEDLTATLKSVFSINDLLSSANLEESEDHVDETVEYICYLNNLTTELNKIEFGNINANYTKKVTNLYNAIEGFLDIANIIGKNENAIDNALSTKDSFLQLPKMIAEFISGNNGKGGLVMVMNRITKAEENGLKTKTIINFFDDVKTILEKVAFIGILSMIASFTSKFIFKAIDTVLEIVSKLSKIKIEEIAGNMKTIEKAAKLITNIRNMFVGLTIAGIFAIPALIGSVIIMVTMKVIIKMINIIAKSMGDLQDPKTQANITGTAKLILIVGGLMVIAALVGGLALQYAKEILGFGLIFGLFALMVLGSIGLVSKLLTDDASKSLKMLCITVVTISLIMVLGALFIQSGLFVHSIMFGVVFAIFLTVIMLPMILMRFIVGKKNMKNMQSFIMLVVACALVMMVGALFMQLNLWKESLKFGLILTIFVTMMMLPLFIFSKIAGGKKGAKFMKSFIALVVTCTLILMLGALFMQTGWGPDALAFAALLAGFIFAVILPFGIFGKKLKKIQGTVIALTVLIVASALMLMLGAWFIEEYGSTSVITFATVLCSFIVIVSGMAILLSKAKGIKKGVIALGVITGCVLLGAFAMTVLGDAFQKFGDWKNALAMAGVLAAVIAAIGLMAVGAGLLLAGPQAIAFGLGIAAMAVISGVALTAAHAIKTIAEAYKTVNDATGGSELDFTNMREIIMGFMDVLVQMSKRGSGIKFFKLKLVCRSMQELGKTISILAVSVAEISNLKVGTAWDKNGVATRFRQLNNSDFENAATNTELIISTLGDAVIKIYEKKPKLFEQPGVLGVFGFGDTVFDKVTKSCGGLGKMISKIAEGVADISNLTVATKWNSEGKPIKFRSLNESDFQKAATNIDLIISILGDSIIGIYNKKKSLFEVPPIEMKIGFIKMKIPGTGKTPFEKVVVACTSMGNMISVLGNSVAEISNLKVATAWNKDGQPIKFRQLTNKDFKNAAKNIKEIITTLGSAIIDLYKQHPEMFEAPKVTSLADVFAICKGTAVNPFEKVVAACTSMGNMISTIGIGVGDMADVKIATDWNNEGKPIKFRHLKSKDFKLAAANTTEILTTLAAAINQVYIDYPHLFGDDLTFENGRLTSNTPIAKVVNAGILLGEMLSSLALGVQAWGAKGEILVPIKWSKTNGAPIDFKPMKVDADQIAKNVTDIVTPIMNALGKLYTEHNTLFDDVVETITVCTHDGLFSDDYSTETINHGNPITKVINAASGIGKLMCGVAEGVREFSKMKVADARAVSGKVDGILLPVLTAFTNVADKVESLNTGNKLEKTKKFIEEVLTPSFEGIKTTVESGKNAFKDLDENNVEAKVTNPFKKFIENVTTIFTETNAKIGGTSKEIEKSSKTLATVFSNIGDAFTEDFAKVPNIIETKFKNVDVFSKNLGTLISGVTVPFTEKMDENVKNKVKAFSDIIKGITQCINDDVAKIYNIVKTNFGDDKFATNLKAFILGVTDGFNTNINKIIISNNIETFKNVTNVLTPAVVNDILSIYKSLVKLDVDDTFGESFKNILTGIFNPFKDNEIFNNTVNTNVESFIAAFNKFAPVIEDCFLPMYKTLSKYSTKLPEFSSNLQTLITGFANSFTTPFTTENCKTVENICTSISSISAVFEDDVLIILKNILQYADKVEKFKTSFKILISGITEPFTNAFTEDNKKTALNINAVICDCANCFDEYFKPLITGFLNVANNSDVFDTTFYKYINAILKPFKYVIIDQNKIVTVENFNKIVSLLSFSFERDGQELYDIVMQKITNVETFTTTFNEFIEGIKKPFKTEEDDKIIKRINRFTKIKSSTIKELVNSVNAINMQKTDKFIELAQELQKLNKTVGGFDGLVNALNGRINETLILLSRKLEEASRAIAASDKSQQTRQNIVKENIREMKKILTTKLQLNITTEELEEHLSKLAAATSSGGGSTGGSDNGGVSGGSGSNDLLRTIKNAVQSIDGKL